MSHHVSYFNTAGINLARSFDEAHLREPPEVTLWFKTEHARLTYSMWLWEQFRDTLLWGYHPYDKATPGPTEFRDFNFMGIHYTLEVEPDPK